jgi:hypothetical protein
MKRFTSLLIGCSMALAGVAMAQQPNEEASPGKKKQQGREHTQAAHQQPTRMRPAARDACEGARSDKRTGHSKGHKAHQESATAQQNEWFRSTGSQCDAWWGKASERDDGTCSENIPCSRSGSCGRRVLLRLCRPATHQKGQANVAAQKGQANVAAGAKKKPDQQKVQQIKAQHASFRAQPKPQQVPAVTYNQNYRIQGSESWQGPQYEVFRAYRPEWHDEGWYRSRYPRVELIGGGYYYWNSGYWYPAWGYSPSAKYYAYDGPIYVGQRAQPPDQVIADVQAELQQMGYYRGEVDGLLGPLTREALTAYQADQGLATTAAIDEPTLDSLGMS